MPDWASDKAKRLAKIQEAMAALEADAKLAAEEERRIEAERSSSATLKAARSRANRRHHYRTNLILRETLAEPRLDWFGLLGSTAAHSEQQILTVCMYLIVPFMGLVLPVWKHRSLTSGLLRGSIVHFLTSVARCASTAIPHPVNEAPGSRRSRASRFEMRLVGKSWARRKAATTDVWKRIAAKEHQVGVSLIDPKGAAPHFCFAVQNRGAPHERSHRCPAQGL